MIVETGHFALVLALFVALVQGSLPMIGAERGIAPWIALARPAAVIQVLLVAFSFAALVYAHAGDDFSLVNVAQNSHSAKPMLYKISGTWGNHEGSMLLWVLILALFGSAVALFGGNLPETYKARVLGVQAWIAAGFHAFILFTSNPFERLVPPAVDGNDLNPLLQDPGLALHPPMLYLGYVGFSIVFSFAVAALIEGRIDAAWARWVRPWTLLAWTFLTGGIALGSWWAYYELGWGGFWFWDPVENASFMPWLVGTALLHSALVVEKREALKAWTVLLAIVTFAFSLLGTFLVRSGVLTSVHAFATDPRRGVFILAILLLYVGGAFALYAWRGPALRGTGLFQPVSREGGLLLNNLILTTAAAAVLLGTLYPLFVDALGLGKISVGAPFFNAVFIPLMLPLLAAMAVGPLLAWKRADLWPALKRLWLAAVAVGLAAGVAWAIEGGPFLGVLGLGIAAWLFVGTVVELAERVRLFQVPALEVLRRLARLPRAAWGMTLAHAGLAIAIAGMAGAGTMRAESIQVMRAGDFVTVAGYTFAFQGASEVQGPNYTATRGGFAVSRDGRPVAMLFPEKRNYPVRNMPTTEAGIQTLFGGDLYAVLGDRDGDGYVTRIYFNPLVAWIWAGSLIMMLAGAVSLSDRRYRVGAPARRARAAAAA